jgi:probable F420-dependent oxidoreductase
VTALDLGPTGLRSVGLRTAESGEALDAAAEIEELGYGAVWIGAGPAAGLEERLRLLLGATRALIVATGILSIWACPPDEAAAMRARLEAEFPSRFVLGLGVSHAPLVAASGGRYRRPLSEMTSYLDTLDAADPPVPAGSRVIAALAPKMLALAAARSLGTYPFLTPPAHTRWARTVLGQSPMLAPDVKVVLDERPDVARRAARDAVQLHLTLPNYVENLVRSGFDRADAANGGSDRLIDAVVACGGVERIDGFAREHRAAGADHIVLDPVAPAALPRDEWRRLAQGGLTRQLA